MEIRVSIEFSDYGATIVSKLRKALSTVLLKIHRSVKTTLLQLTALLQH